MTKTLRLPREMIDRIEALRDLYAVAAKGSKDVRSDPRTSETLIVESLIALGLAQVDLEKVNGMDSLLMSKPMQARGAVRK